MKVESVPWATGKHRVTDTYAWFLAGWAKRLSWQEVATVFHSSWDTVSRSVRMAVEWGLAHRDLEGIEAIGIDELARRRGHRYLTLVYQIDRHCKRLLWIGRERKASVEPVRASLGSLAGGAVRLAQPEPGRPLLVGEGIESTAAAMLLFDLPGWAALGTGQLAAADLAERLEDSEGRRVEIRAPCTGDFADWL